MFWKGVSCLRVTFAVFVLPHRKRGIEVVQVSTDHALTILRARLCPGPLLCPWSVAPASRHVRLSSVSPAGAPRFPPRQGTGRGGAVASQGCGVAGALSVEGAGWGRQGGTPGGGEGG